jgi:hypothetical protein
MTCSIRPLVFLPRIIGGLLLVILTGCSAIKLGYSNAPTLTYWWLDSYIDFTAEQSPPARDSLATLHAWHRTNELPAYADTLRSMQQLAPGKVTPDQLCGLWTEVQTHIQHLGMQSAQAISTITPTLKPEQLRHLALQFDKRNRKWREEWLDVTPAELTERRLKQAVDRSEMLYGQLDDAQLALLRQSIELSSFDAQLTYRERLRRQQDILQILQEHSASGLSRPAHVQAEVMALLERLRLSPDPVYRAHQEKITAEGCATLAVLHNSSSAAQRTKLMETLRDYEADARALANSLNQDR